MERTVEEIQRENFFLNDLVENLVARLETCENRTDTIKHLLYLGYCEEELTKIGYELNEITEAKKETEEARIEEQMPF